MSWRFTSRWGWCATCSEGAQAGRRRSSCTPTGWEELGHRALLDYRRRKGLPISLKMRWSPLSVVFQAKYGVRHAEHVICSNAQDVRHLRTVGIAASRVTEVPSGVSSEFLGVEPDWSRDPQTMLFVGTWIPRKGIADLVAASAKVLRKEPRAGLTVAGCGASRERVLAEFPADVRCRVTVIPHLASDRELVERYRRHAVFVLPSFFEGYPLAMLEAAALGLALVTTDACGMDEFVEDGENGLKVRVGDPQGLADALLSLIRDGAETRRLGERARRKAGEFLVGPSGEPGPERVRAGHSAQPGAPSPREGHGVVTVPRVGVLLSS